MAACLELSLRFRWAGSFTRLWALVQLVLLFWADSLPAYLYRFFFVVVLLLFVLPGVNSHLFSFPRGRLGDGCRIIEIRF